MKYLFFIGLILIVSQLSCKKKKEKEGFSIRLPKAFNILWETPQKRDVLFTWSDPKIKFDLNGPLKFPRGIYLSKIFDPIYVDGEAYPSTVVVGNPFRSSRRYPQKTLLNKLSIYTKRGVKLETFDLQGFGYFLHEDNNTPETYFLKRQVHISNITLGKFRAEYCEVKNESKLELQLQQIKLDTLLISNCNPWENHDFPLLTFYSSDFESMGFLKTRWKRI